MLSGDLSLSLSLSLSLKTQTYRLFETVAGDLSLSLSLSLSDLQMNAVKGDDPTQTERNDNIFWMWEGRHKRDATP